MEADLAPAAFELGKKLSIVIRAVDVKPDFCKRSVRLCQIKETLPL